MTKLVLGLGDTLSVRVDADTGSFSRAMSSAEDDLRGLSDEAIAVSGAMQALQGRTDAAEDEMAGLARESDDASRSLRGTAASAGGVIATFTGLSAITSLLSFNLTSLANTPALLLFPALTAGATALLATLFPLAAIVGTLTAGLAALAAAFGIVVGTGLVAFNEEVQPLTEALADLREELTPIIVAFGRNFIPLIEDALDAIPTLVEDTLDAVGGMGTFAVVLRDLGRAAMDVIPALVAGMVEFAQSALPAFLRFINFVRSNGEAAFEGMLRVTRFLMPALRDLGSAFMNNIREITLLGAVVLNELLPAFADFLRLVGDVVNIGEGSDSLAGFLNTVVNNALAWVRGPGLTAIQSVGSTLLGALATALSPTGDEDAGFFSALVNRISSVLRGLATWMESGGQQQITNTLTALFDSFGSTIDGEADTFANKIIAPLTTVLTGALRGLMQALASDEAGELSSAIGRFASQLGQLVTQGLAQYFTSDQFESDLVLLGKAIATTLGNFIVSYIRENPETVLTGGVNLLGARVGEEFVQQFSPTETIPEAAQTGQADIGRTEVRVNVEGDTDVVRNVSAEVVNEQEREATRQTGGRLTPGS